MSIEVTIRQKAIKVCASAAICGLSISFLLGEVIDQRAHLLREWEADPQLIPSGYSVLAPIQAGMQLMDPAVWSERLAAYNQSEILEKIVSVEAAPQKSSSDEPASAVKTEIALAAAAKRQEVTTREVETILMSIHQATRDLSGQSAEPLMQKVVSEQKQKQDTVPMGMVVIESNSLPQKPEPLEPKAASEGQKGSWIIAGKILTDQAIELAGHYEVGLFSKIDPEGNPVGFPIVQQILPSGKRDFRLAIPSPITKGFLYGEFVAAKTGKRNWIPAPLNPFLKKGTESFAELVHRQEDKVSSIAAASIRPDTVRISGKVLAMFARGQALPQGDVVVKVRGRKDATRSAADGSFSIELQQLKGTLYLEFLKAGFHPMVVPVNVSERNELTVEMASREAIEKLASSLGVRQASTKGVFLGKIAQKGASAQLSLKADGPYYFSDAGYPEAEKRGTSSDGRFLFFNVEPGAGYAELQVQGDSVAPFQISFVEGGEFVHKQIQLSTGKIKGRLFNPIQAAGRLAPMPGARVRIEGASESTTTDSYGAFSIGPMKYAKGEELSLEVSAEKFYNHKYRVRTIERELNLFAFPAQYVNRLATSMDVSLDPYSAIILGKVSGASVRMDALSDHSPSNSAKDFYFDQKGSLLGSHQMTDPRFGTYIIFNVPRGRTLLQGNDAGGVARYSDAVSLSASSVTVVMD